MFVVLFYARDVAAKYFACVECGKSLWVCPSIYAGYCFFLVDGFLFNVCLVNGFPLPCKSLCFIKERLLQGINKPARHL